MSQKDTNSEPRHVNASASDIYAGIGDEGIGRSGAGREKAQDFTDGDYVLELEVTHQGTTSGNNGKAQTNYAVLEWRVISSSPINKKDRQDPSAHADMPLPAGTLGKYWLKLSRDPVSQVDITAAIKAHLAEGLDMDDFVTPLGPLSKLGIRNAKRLRGLIGELLGGKAKWGDKIDKALTFDRITGIMVGSSGLRDGKTAAEIEEVETERGYRLHDLRKVRVKCLAFTPIAGEVRGKPGEFYRPFRNLKFTACAQPDRPTEPEPEPEGSTGSTGGYRYDDDKDQEDGIPPF